MENENNFGLSAEDRAALDEMKKLKAEQARQEELKKARDFKRETFLKDESVRLLYDSYGLKEEIDADESILDSDAAIRFAVKEANSRLKAERDAANQNQIKEPEAAPQVVPNEPARPQSGVSSGTLEDDRFIPKGASVDEIAKKTGWSPAAAALAKMYPNAIN